ncbi:MAG: pantoate--beta-alanine ligase [Proteobacteria bacterium]|nr:pantoate--beta-alanine ligase [Pseudomonadota bacterium]
MKIIEETGQMKAEALKVRSAGSQSVLVPTMGALHRGHIELIREARRLAGAKGSVVLSLFVNPTQFAPGEDLGKYPRTLEADIEVCKTEGVDVLFTPTPLGLYPEGFSTSIDVGSLGTKLCGLSRPGHFNGVATVVVKLFGITAPDIAVFGKKDFQQLAVIRRVVVDLDIGVEITGVETVREADGLAMSSRNRYLDDKARKEATAIAAALKTAAALYSTGEQRSAALVAAALEVLGREVSIEVEYIKVSSAESLEELETVDKKAFLALAVRISGTRLIDNIELC